MTTILVLAALQLISSIASMFLHDYHMRRCETFLMVIHGYNAIPALYFFKYVFHPSLIVIIFPFVFIRAFIRAFRKPKHHQLPRH